MNELGNRITPLLTIHEIIISISVFLVGDTVHRGNRGINQQRVNQQRLLLNRPHKRPLHSRIISRSSLIHLLDKGACRPRQSLLIKTPNLTDIIRKIHHHLGLLILGAVNSGNAHHLAHGILLFIIYYGFHFQVSFTDSIFNFSNLYSVVNLVTSIPLTS